MSICKCPECGSSISSYSKNCIHCGFPLSKTKELMNERRDYTKRDYEHLIDVIKNGNFDEIKIPSALEEETDEELQNLAGEALYVSLHKASGLSPFQLYQIAVRFGEIAGFDEVADCIVEWIPSLSSESSAPGKIAALSAYLKDNEDIEFSSSNHDYIVETIMDSNDEFWHFVYTEYFSSLIELNADDSLLCEVVNKWANRGIATDVDVRDLADGPAFMDIEDGLDHSLESVEMDCEDIIAKVCDEIRKFVSESRAEKLIYSIDCSENILFLKERAVWYTPSDPNLVPGLS